MGGGSVFSGRDGKLFDAIMCWATFQFALVVEERFPLGQILRYSIDSQSRFGHLGHQIDYLLCIFLCIRITQNMPELLKIPLQLLKIYEEYKSTSSREDLRVEEVVRRESRNEYAV